MPDAPATLDPTKMPAGAMTMVYKDYYFLRRWVDYYGRQFGRQHLYILSHGGDPEHARIAEGANVIRIPRDPTLFRLERRRWGINSKFSAGMLRYYNWFIVGDVDEVVVVDPAVAPDLPTYLSRYTNSKTTPKSLSPFGIELIHNPEVEPEPLADDATILSRRRVFRANANYAKPCVLRAEAGFTIGGHANTHQPRVLDPHLYLLHLRFFDHDRVTERLQGRKELRATMSGEDHVKGKGKAWGNDLATFQKLSKLKPVREDAELADFRRKMLDQKEDLHDGKITFFGGGRTKELYRLPERFASVF
ncbi:MAG: glycosyltransferase family 2 protein [Alphaproteobacteria bacterium]